jgi:uncharacterized DUF497 family protein
MEFEWDENKNRENKRKHGVSFQKAAKIFEGRVLRKVDNRFDYGEERISALGKADGRVLKVIYTMRGKKIRIISSRKANKNERRIYYYHMQFGQSPRR